MSIVRKYGTAAIAAVFCIASASALAEECELSGYLVDYEGELAPTAVINHSDVKSMEWNPDMQGMAVWQIKLSEEAGERLYEATQAHIGLPMALFCGAEEIERMRIMAPLGAEFMVKGLDAEIKYSDMLRQ